MRAAALLGLALLAGAAGASGPPGTAGGAGPLGVAGPPGVAGAAPSSPGRPALVRPRRRRAPHSLLGPFDFSKLFKKKKPKPKPELDPVPSAFPLHAASSPERSTWTALPVDSPAPNSTVPSVLSIPPDDEPSPRNSTPESILWLDSAAPPGVPPGDLAGLFAPEETTAARARAATLNSSLELRKIDDRIVSLTTVETPKKKSKGKLRKIKMSNNSTSIGAKSRSASGRRSTKPAAVAGASGATVAAGAAGAAGATGASGAARDEPPLQWPLKHAAVVEGDIILGGLMMVHGRSEGATCGPVMAQGGVQALEAMLFALDHARAARLGPPGLRVGALVLDDCDNDTYGLEMALDFIKGSIGNIEERPEACAAPGAARPVISGVVGAASSVTSVQVANLLRLFKIPQVSYFSTSPELSNKQRFEYFTRTIPSDLHQARAIVAIVKTFGWRYVSIIYEESNYGIKAFEELETLLARDEICIAVKERLVKDSGEAPASAYDAIVARLLSRPRARGVIVFGSDQEVAGVMAAVVRAGAEGTFGWVGSDGWSARALVAAGRERAVEGTVSVQPLARPVRGFREYFLNLTVQNNRRNPWFVEFWEEQFRCRWEGPGAARTPYNAHARRCSGRERLSAANTELEAQLQFVADAVLALVHALRDLHAAECGAPGACPALRRAAGPALLRYLRNVRFTGLSGEEFRFDANGDGPARYNILHFKQVERGVFRWLRVGRYLDGALELDMDEIQFKWDSPRPPPSVCSAECELGQAKQYVEGESCCWHCFNCSQYEIRSPESETACWECPRGTLPDAARTRCEPLPAQYLRPAAPAARGAMAFSAAGIVCTLFVLGVWARRGDTPVVRASGRELSFVLLGGILMCYLLTFLLVLRPTDALCTAQRFGTGLCFTVVYAALLTKTNRIARIFAAGARGRPAFISPRAQLAACAALVGAQLAGLAAWQAAAPARAVRHLPARDAAVLVCDAYVDASHALAFGYPAALVLTCTVYAVLTRKIPEAFNESKHIGFTMYTTCVIWLAFVPLYFGTASHVTLRVTTIAVTISLSASVTLACLFAPKVYIILLRPERNVRASLMPGRWRAGAGAGAAGGAVCAALVGAAPLPPARAPPPATPSTDRSTLNDNDRTPGSCLDRQVQTDPLEAFPALRAPPGAELALSARALGAADGGLPPFAPREAPPAPPPAPAAPPGALDSRL